MREHIRGTRWRHAAARVGAVAVLAGVLVGGVVAGALLGGAVGSQVHTVVRPLADVAHPDPPPNDPK